MPHYSLVSRFSKGWALGLRKESCRSPDKDPGARVSNPWKALPPSLCCRWEKTWLSGVEVFMEEIHLPIGLDPCASSWFLFRNCGKKLHGFTRAKHWRFMSSRIEFLFGWTDLVKSLTTKSGILQTWSVVLLRMHTTILVCEKEFSQQYDCSKNKSGSLCLFQFSGQSQRLTCVHL